MIRMNLVAAHQFNSIQIPRTQFQVAVAIFGFFDQQCRRSRFQIVKRLTEQLGLRFFYVERVHHDQLAIANLRSTQIVNIYSCHMLLTEARPSRPSTAIPFSLPSSPPSEDQLSSARRTRAALLAASSLW